METNLLKSLSSNSPPSATSFLPSSTVANPCTQISLPRRSHRPYVITYCTRGDGGDGGSNSSSGGNEVSQPVMPPITPPDTVEVRFRRGSRRRRQMGEDGYGQGQPVKAQAPPPAPKKWEEMSVTEKVMELYVGEKGLLFWLNKFAYASIFIMIGAWILFRFVGPALNFYQLDSPPLSPTEAF